MNLVFSGATKFYGSAIGVNNIHCTLTPGITGLVGANGAGKSTMLKLASGQIRPSQGRVAIGPHAAHSVEARRRIGFSPDADRFFDDLTGRQFVETMARMHGLPAPLARDRTAAVLEEVGMQRRADRRLGGYSHGMRQRVKLAQALVHDPDVLLLDEPLNGIDPGGRREIQAVLVRLAKAGKTVVVSTHILSEIEQLADVIVVVSRGRTIASGAVEQIRRLLADRPLTVRVDAANSRRLAGLLAQATCVRGIDVADDVLIVRTIHAESFFALLGEIAVDEQFGVQRLETLDAGVEAVFGYLERDA